MKRFLNLGIDFVNILTITLFTSIGIWYISLLLNGPVVLEVPFYVAILFIFSCLCNIHIHNFGVYAFMHMVLAAVIFFLPFIFITKLILLSVFIIICMIDLTYWKDSLKPPSIALPLSMVILFLITCVHGLSGLSTFLGNVSYYFGIAYVILTLLRIYLCNMLDFNNNEVSGKKFIPLRNILRQNTLMVAVINISLFIIAILFRSRLLERLLGNFFYFLKDLVKKVLFFLLRYFKSSGSENVPEPQKTEATNSLFALTEKRVNPILEFILNLIQTILEIAACTIFIYLILFGIYSFFKHYHTRKSNTEKQDREYHVIETKEKLPNKKNTYRRSFLSNKTENEKLRLYYKKRIQNLIKKGYQNQNSHTPKERALDIQNQTNHRIDDLTHYYEKARYSSVEITKQEVKALIKKQ